MQGVVARRNNFVEPILDFFEAAYEDFAALTGRYYGLVSQYKSRGRGHGVRVARLGGGEHRGGGRLPARARNASVGSIHINVFRPFPEAAVVNALAGKKNVIILERTDEPMAGDNPMGRDIRTALNKALQGVDGIPKITPAQMPRLFARHLRARLARFPARAHDRRVRVSPSGSARAQGRQARGRRRDLHRARRRSSVRGEVGRHAVAAARQGDRGPVPFRRRLGRDHDRQEPRRDHRRPQRSPLRARQGRRRVRQSEGDHPRQREPEVRFGEEGRADRRTS